MDKVVDRQAPAEDQVKAAADVLWEWLGDGRDQNEPESVLRDLVSMMLGAAQAVGKLSH